ncbi:M15 family metallopeptidase [Limnohabitans sp. DCL3]|uniref:M15 family metallopeptidase n=1 Tax=Limnohabitans sp. DCL3 TaxID=3374103 RepID=UPI003A8BE094
MRTPNGYDEIKAIFGNPKAADGTLNPVWEAKNIKTVRPPAGWQLYYQDYNGPIKVSGLRVHRLLEPSLTNVLREVWEYARGQLGAAATEAEIRDWLHQRRVDLHGGAFNYRKKRVTSKELSLHSFGIALDWDPLNNPQKVPLTKTLPDWWYAIWQANGWHDGRNFSKPDPMHVQFATGA